MPPHYRHEISQERTAPCFQGPRSRAPQSQIMGTKGCHAWDVDVHYDPSPSEPVGLLAPVVIRCWLKENVTLRRKYADGR